MPENTQQALDEALADIKLIDTHEHVVAESVRLGMTLDFTYLMPHYISSDLVSAGMSVDDLEAVRAPGRCMVNALRKGINHRKADYEFAERLPTQEPSLGEKWRRLGPFWARTRNTGYARCLLIAMRDLFGIDDLNEQTYGPLSEALQASNQKGWYRHVLKERAGIEMSVEDYGTTHVDRELFAPSVRFDRFVDIRELVDIRKLEHDSGVLIHRVDDLVRAMETDMHRKVQEGMVAVKCGLAYDRTIYFGEATLHEAEQVFNRLFRCRDERLPWEEAKPLQDYMMHQVIEHAIEYGLPIQIHTGLQEGNGNVLANSNPTLLTNLFFQYPRARFDIFHCSYPYHGELGVLAKNFPNVYADMAWMYIVSPRAAGRILHEWLETIPVSKILGFGGDFIIVEGAYGHSRLARQVVARVLAEKVADGDCTEQEAVTFGRMILRENAKELFKL
jgi:uncharacterized protein